VKGVENQAISADAVVPIARGSGQFAVRDPGRWRGGGKQDGERRLSFG
jgi:hypothetical protein